MAETVPGEAMQGFLNQTAPITRGEVYRILDDYLTNTRESGWPEARRADVVANVRERGIFRSVFLKKFVHEWLVEPEAATETRHDLEMGR